MSVMGVGYAHRTDNVNDEDGVFETRLKSAEDEASGLVVEHGSEVVGKIEGRVQHQLPAYAQDE